jgi:integrase
MRTRLSDKRLYWRGRKLWAKVLGPGGQIIRRATGCTDPKAGSARADEFERIAADPSYAASATATLNSAIASYLEELDRRGSSDATKGIARSKLGHFVRLWGGDRQLRTITSSLIVEFIDARNKEGVVDYTIAKELGQLRQLLKLARYLGTFKAELDTIFPPRIAGSYTPRDRWPVPAEITKLRRRLTDDRFAFALFILATGARLSEVRRARREDIGRDEVLLRGTKTPKSKAAVPITEITRPLLVRVLELTNPRPGGLLFERWHNVQRDLALACELANIARLSPNDLRRGYGHWHRRSGVSLDLVADLLRHSTTALAHRTYASLDAGGLGPLVAQELRNSSVLIMYGAHGAHDANGDGDTMKSSEKQYARQESNLRHSASKAEPQTVSGIVNHSVLRADSRGGVSNLYEIPPRHSAPIRQPGVLADLELGPLHGLPLAPGWHVAAASALTSCRVAALGGLG